MDTSGARSLNGTLDIYASKTVDGQNHSSIESHDGKNVFVHTLGDDTSLINPVELTGGHSAEKFLATSLQAASDEGLTNIAIKFLIPNRDGYIVKSDFLEWRFESKGWLVSGFTTPLQFVDGLPPALWESVDLSKLLSFAVGAILLQNPRSGSLSDLEAVLESRLSFPWLSTTPIAPKRLAMIQDPASLLPARRRWEAAASLGIKLVLVSSSPFIPGEKDFFESIFESYVEVDMSPDAGLARRIADALRPSVNSLDGIFATKDNKLTCVAEAAELLGFFASPSEVHSKAGDKFLTRVTEPDVENTFLVESMEETESIMNLLPSEPFPLVVKPCRGDAGQCVAKVSNEKGLRQALKDALAFASPPRALIEPYIRGPEVDVNFVLLDGQILFGGVCDNFPSQADREISDESLYFAETKNLSPSLLPQSEQELLVRHFHQTLVRQGFRTGVFHVEGRVRNSAMQYTADDSGSLDLHVHGDQDSLEPSAFLHEINARPPGFQACAAFLLCFGIDFWALQMLSAARDWDRLKALSIPIPVDSRDHLSVENLHFPVTEAAVKATFPSLDTTIKRLHFMGDPMPELRAYSSELDAQAVQCQVCINAGEVYGGSGWLWLTTFVVASRKGRKEALRMSDVMVHKYRDAVQAISGIQSTPARTPVTTK